ncbi:MAG: hypothetical protein JOZ57_03385 [Abitibacteriaceae bacterium]|nr:hypothetical protein [Abditibacteriaceae bacterium]
MDAGSRTLLGGAAPGAAASCGLPSCGSWAGDGCGATEAGPLAVPVPALLVAGRLSVGSAVSGLVGRAEALSGGCPARGESIAGSFVH